jgi:hypothetical protein
MFTLTRRILVSAPRDSVRQYLADLSAIAAYDPKVDAIEPLAGGAEAAASGHVLGLRWRGTFRFEATSDGGYHAAMVKGPLRRMECKVSLRPVTGGTMLEREETYELRLLLLPFSPLLRRWLDDALERELGLIKEGAEALNRRLQLQRLEASS